MHLLRPNSHSSQLASSSNRYYNNLSYNYRDSDSIAAYYAADAVGGSRCWGWEAVLFASHTHAG